MKTLRVDLGERSYPIHIGNGMLEQLPGVLGEATGPRRIFVVTDDVVQELYAANLLQVLSDAHYSVKIASFSHGEAQKNLATFEHIITAMLQEGVGRDWGLIALGGGVVGDLAGYVAASYMRGIDFIQIPTTLLAQVDASVGGKVGINHPLAKNTIGAFYQPQLVWIDLACLPSLPAREIVSGLAEIIKTAMIRDASFFAFCEENLDRLLALDSGFLSTAIYRSCQIKAAVVSEDEKEMGQRAILNFGHTIGHAIEAATGYSVLRHGEAVLLGMLAEARIAHDSKRLAAPDFARFERLLLQIPLKATLDGIRFSDLTTYMRYDKKVVDETIRFVLPAAIGRVELVNDVSPELIAAALSYLQSFGWSSQGT